MQCTFIEGLLPHFWFMKRNFREKNPCSVEGVQEWVQIYEKEGKRTGKLGFGLEIDIVWGWKVQIGDHKPSCQTHTSINLNQSRKYQMGWTKRNTKLLSSFAWKKYSE